MRIEQIIKEHKQDFKKIARKYGLRMILLFGSGAASKLHPKSDIDIAIYSEKGNLSLDNYSALLCELQKIFSEREVDLVLVNKADPLFLKKIMENCRLLYGHPRDLFRQKIYAYKRYLDHRKYFEMEKKYVDKFIHRYV